MYLLWIGAVTLLYRFTIVLYLRRFDRMWVHIAAALICAAVLGPGLLIGHGVLPAPAGFAFAIEVQHLFEAGTVSHWPNLLSWPATALVFALASMSTAPVTRPK